MEHTIEYSAAERMLMIVSGNGINTIFIFYYRNKRDGWMRETSIITIQK